jgi:hypothetical protein
MGLSDRMKPTLQRLAVLAGTIAAAAGAFAQGSQIPTGNWQSAGTATYTNPALTGAELYLDIDVAKDGSFRGVWGRYLCTSFPGAYASSIHSCTRTGSNRVSGRFGPGRRGLIDLERLGRSAFSWTAPATGELAIELPKNWQGSDAILYRARLTRDGKEKPAARSSAARDEGPLLSANALYREFERDSSGALKRYAGKTLVLEGRRGALVPLGDGGAAIHIPDGATSRALVLVFPDRKQADGIKEGAQFRFSCTVVHFDYQYVYMENCAIARE